MSDGVLRSLAVPNFRRWVGGQLVSQTGDWMLRVGQAWLVLQLSDSGLVLGLAVCCQFAPSLLLGLWGGVLADRMDKRRLLMTMQMGIAGCAAVLAVLDLTGLVQVWHVLVVAVVTGALIAVEMPTRHAFVPEIVGRAHIANAVALNSAVFNVAGVVGPAVGGLLISQVGTGWLFVAKAVTAFAVFSAVASMRTDQLHPGPRLPRGRGQLAAGVGYVRSRPDLLLVVLTCVVVGAVGQQTEVLNPVLARDVFDRGAGGYGLLASATALGSIAGAVVAARRRGAASVTFVPWSAVALGASLLLVSVAPTFWVAAAVLVAVGFAVFSTLTAANSYLQLTTAPQWRGRVLSLYLVSLMGGRPLGALLLGGATSALGPRTGPAVAGGLCAGAALVLVLVLGRRARRATPAPDPEPVELAGS